MKEIKFAIAAMILLPLASHATSNNNDSEFTIGFASQYAPEYTGSDKYDLNVTPYFEWVKGPWFLNSEKGIGISQQFENGLYFSQALGYSAGRSDSSSWFQEGSKNLKGMGKIKSALNSNTTLGWWMFPWFGLEGNVIAPITDSQGMQYTLGVNLIAFSSEADTVTISTMQKYGDARYNNTWFGVTESQSERSGFQKYNTGSGLNSIDYSVNWQHSFDENWSGYADIRYTTLGNHARRSSIAKKDDYFVLTVGAFYTF